VKRRNGKVGKRRRPKEGVKRRWGERGKNIKNISKGKKKMERDRGGRGEDKGEGGFTTAILKKSP
jgi:hypothetical protein